MVGEQEKGDLVKIGAAWEMSKDGGEKFFSGSLGEAQLFIFKNKYKDESKNHPDYNIFVSKRKKKEEESSKNSWNRV